MEIPFHNLSLLLECKHPSRVSEDMLLNLIIQWMHHCREERETHFNVLLKNVDLSKVSKNYLKLLITEYGNLVNHKLKSTKDAHSDTHSDTHVQFLDVVRPNFDNAMKNVHVYVDYDERRMGILSTCNNLDNWFLSGVFSNYEILTMRHVALNNIIILLMFIFYRTVWRPK